MSDSAKKIAVVDDSQLSRTFVATALAHLSWAEVEMFEDGQSAWQALRNGNSADIVLSDIKMPGMDGLELLRRLKATGPEKPCILMSAISRFRKDAEALQADGFLTKPFTIADLFKVMEPFA